MPHTLVPHHQVTAEEYCTRFVAQLQSVLAECSPEKHSVQVRDFSARTPQPRCMYVPQAMLLGLLVAVCGNA